MKKRLIITTIGFAGAFLILSLSVYFYAKTDHAKTQLVSQINIAIPGQLSAENLEFSLFKSYVKLDEVQIKDLRNNICCKFKSLFIKAKISSLFKKNLEIVLFQVNSPEISLIMDTKGRINLLDALIKQDDNVPENEPGIKKAKGIPFNVIVKKAQIIEGGLDFNDPDNSISIRSLQIDLLDGNLQEQRLSLNAGFKNSRITLKDKEILVKNITLLSELEQGSKLNFDVDLDSDLGIFKAKGSASNINSGPEIDILIDARSNLDQLNLFLENKLSLGGLARVSIAVKGPVNNPDATFKLDVTDVKVGESIKKDVHIEKQEIHLSASIADRTLSLKKGILNVLGSNIECTGKVDFKNFFPKGFLHPAGNLDALTYDFSFDQKNGDFRHLKKWAKEFSGQFSSFGNINGKGIDPEALAANYNVTLILEEFKRNKAETDSLDFKTDITGTIEKGIFELTRLNARTGDTSIDLMGQYDISKKTLAADLTLTSRDLYSTTIGLGIPPVKGSIDSKLNIAGDIINPEIKAMVSGKDIEAKGISINDLQFKGTLNSSGQADIQQFIIQDQDLVFEMNGSVDVFDKKFTVKDVIQANILVSGQNINPQRLLKPFDIKTNPDPLDSLIDFNLTIDADYAIGASMDKKDFHKIEIPIKNITAGIDLGKNELTMVIGEIASLNASLNTENNGYNTRINFNHSDLTPLFKSLGINVLRTDIHGQINASGVIPVVLPENITKGLNTAHGNITLTADINGSFKEPDFNVLVDLSNLSYDGTQAGLEVSNLHGNIMVTPDKITINALKTDLNKGHLALSGNVGLKEYKIQDCRLDITLDSLDIPLPSKTGPKDNIIVEKFDSQIDINLQHGPKESQRTGKLPVQEIPIKHIIADLTLNDLGLSVLVDKTTDLKASFDPENSDYTLGIDFDQTPLDTLFKNLGFDKVKGKMNGHIASKGKVNIALPGEVIHGLKKATGKLTCSADIKGSLEKPDFNAVVTLTNLGYPIPQAGTSISNLTGKIKVSKDLLKIEDIAGDIDNGKFGMDGEIGLRNFKPVKGSLQLTGNNIALELPDTAKIEFSYDLTFSGTPDKSDLSGTFILGKGEYYKDFTFDLTETVGDKKRKTSTPANKSSTTAPLIENTSLNIDVDYKNPFIVDNNLAFILIEPNVNITGTAANPIITGRTKIIEGTIIYLKREFEIENGIIDFVDPYKIDPDINLAAKIQVRDWTITLEVSGKTENLKFRLFSQPEEAHEDILSLLIAGKTTEELGEDKGGLYTNILTDKASDIIGETVEESTPLDSFKVGYDDSGSEGANVTLGKKLSKRLEVLYSMETIDQETVHKNAAEYKILENIMLKAFNDSKGDFGTEVTFKLEFR